MDDVEQQIEAYVEWKARMNRKHRTMTFSEYRAWKVAGDAVCHPSSANCFTGGLTLVPDDGIIGTIEGYEPPPAAIGGLSE